MAFCLKGSSYKQLKFPDFRSIAIWTLLYKFVNRFLCKILFFKLLINDRL